MNKAVEVLFEDKVFKPLDPVDGIADHDRAWILICPSRRRNSLMRLFGTLSSDDARSMRNNIEDEFEKIEGPW